MSPKPKPRPTNSKSPVLRFLALCVAYWGVALFVLSRFPGVERFGIAITVATVEKAFCAAQHLEHLDGFGHDFGADTITGE